MPYQEVVAIQQVSDATPIISLFQWIDSLMYRVRSEDTGTDAELGAATMSVLRAMAMSPDNPRVSKSKYTPPCPHHCRQWKEIGGF